MRRSAADEAERPAYSEEPLDETSDTWNNCGTGRNEATLTGALRAVIQRSGLTYYRLAKATGIDEASMGRFARGDAHVRTGKADRLAACLGLRLTPDPDAVPPEPTPENLARPTLAKRTPKGKEN